MPLFINEHGKYLPGQLWHLRLLKYIILMSQETRNWELILMFLVLIFGNSACRQSRLIAIIAKTVGRTILQQLSFCCFVLYELMNIFMKLSYDFDIISYKCWIVDSTVTLG